MAQIPFRKMHGLGNDFVVLDRRRHSVAIDARAARALADRRTGIGCDQVILIEPPHDPAAQLFMRILNADGSEAEACGNASRCIARLVAEETGDRRVTIETVAGLLATELLPDHSTPVDMAPAGATSRSFGKWTPTGWTSRSARWPRRSAPISATRTRPSLSPMPRRSTS